MDVKQIQEMNEAFVAFKKANDEYLDQVKTYGTALGDTKSQVEKLQTALDDIEKKVNKVELEAAKTAAVEKIIESIEARMNRKGSGSDDEGDDERKSHRANFFKAIRTGYRPTEIGSSRVLSEAELKSVLEPAYMKALVTGNDTAGGYLAPLEYAAEIIKGVVEWSPIRSIARLRTTSKMGVQMPKRTTSASAAWVAETGTRAETTNPAFGGEEIRAHEMYAMTKVSRQELEDAAFDIEGFLREEFTEQFGVLEGTAFVSGNAVGKPEGFLTNASVSYVASGHATEITADGLIALYYEPYETYINAGTFVMSRPTLKTIRQLKDGQGNYLWSPGIKTDARPATILDRPYVIAPDMPTIGAGTYPVAFGDFRRAYVIVDRVVMEMMVDPYASKSSGMIEFSARKRVGGQVILPEAIKKLKIATS